jgi:hypothetical protein
VPGGRGVLEPLPAGRELALAYGALAHLCLYAPSTSRRNSAAWLEGRPDAVAQATEVAFELAQRCRDGWPTGELACWRRRAGIEEEMPPGAAEPYALQLAGDWRGAADLWAQLGCPYEAALALADADVDAALRRRLQELQRLGARPAAAIVARRLRRRGTRGLPRGPRLGLCRTPPA